jgi:hypothetical protein
LRKDRSFPEVFLLLSALIVATAFALPKASVADARHMVHSLPARFDREKKWTSADLRIFVDPKGRILECKVVNYAGFEDVAKTMCDIYRTRRIKSAKDLTGQAAYGLTVVRVGFHNSPSDPPPDLGPLYSEELILTVDRLPTNGAGEPVNSYPIGLVIGPEGRVTACKALDALPETLAGIGCAQSAGSVFEVMKNPDGDPVSYVRKINVTFELAHIQPSNQGGL